MSREDDWSDELADDLQETAIELTQAARELLAYFEKASQSYTRAAYLKTMSDAVSDSEHMLEKLRAAYEKARAEPGTS
jgi:sulfur relay (sulfurtransferase) DsrC/TusE family protein